MDSRFPPSAQSFRFAGPEDTQRLRASRPPHPRSRDSPDSRPVFLGASRSHRSARETRREKRRRGFVAIRLLRRRPRALVRVAAFWGHFLPFVPNFWKTQSYFEIETAVERVIGGLKKQNNLMSDHDRKVIAIHESGHAVAGWFSEHSDPLLKVSIVPRSSGALGYAQYMPEDIPLYSREALVDRMRITLAGRAAEELFIGRITTGAADDLNKVTNIAHQMVVVQGMNEAVGLLSYPPKQNGDPEFIRPHSEETARIMDQEKKRLVDDQYNFVKNLLLEHQEKLKQLADLLLIKEVLVTEDLVDILGERPWGLKDQYKKFVDVRRHLDEQRQAETAAAEEKAAEQAAKKAAEDVTEVEVETATGEKVAAQA